MPSSRVEMGEVGHLDDQPPAPWLDHEPDARLETETLVIGGGAAGLSAGLTLARARRAQRDAAARGAAAESPHPTTAAMAQ